MTEPVLFFVVTGLSQGKQFGICTRTLEELGGKYF